MNAFTMPAGTDLSLGIAVTEAGAPKDLTDAQLIFVMKYGTAKITKAPSVVSGKIIVMLDRADTAASPRGVWSFTVGVVDDANHKSNVSTGTIEVLESDIAEWPEGEI